MIYSKPHAGSMLLLAALLLPMAVPAGPYSEALEAYDVDDYFKAHKLFLQAAEAGDPRAQFEVGKLYYKGLGVIRDKEEGLRWLQTGAENGSADAANELGDIYLSGKGVDVDHQASTEWYRMAAERGHAQAQYNLGASYFRGREGVPPDYFMSYVWMQMSTRGGYQAALNYAKTMEVVLTPEDIDRANQLVEEMELNISREKQQQPVDDTVPADP